MLKSLVAASAGIALFGASGLVLSGSASAGVSLGGCKVPASVNNSKGKGGETSFFSSNTNAGNGNGSEVATVIGCVSGIPFPDNAININVNSGGGFIATDPGNSLPHQQTIP